MLKPPNGSMLTATDTLTCYSAVTSMRGPIPKSSGVTAPEPTATPMQRCFRRSPATGVVLDIDAGDIDGDGDRDIVLTRTGDGTGALAFYQGYYLQLLEQRGARQFSDVTAAELGGHRDPEARSLNWVRIYDTDGDGDLDILVDDDTSQDLVWQNDGSGRFVRVEGKRR